MAMRVGRRGELHTVGRGGGWAWDSRSRDGLNGARPPVRLYHRLALKRLHVSAPATCPARHVPLATQVPVYFVDGIAIEDGPANAAAGRWG